MIQSTVLIYENINDKVNAFKNGKPVLENTLLTLAKTNILVNKKKIAKITYVQSSTGECDYIIHLNSENIEDLMMAINILREIPQIRDTKTHIGPVIYP